FACQIAGPESAYQSNLDSTFRDSPPLTRFDCRTGAGRQGAPHRSPPLTPDSAQSAYRDGSASPPPSHARIFPGAAAKAAGARVAEEIGKDVAKVCSSRGPHFRLGGLQHLGDGFSQPTIGGDFALQLFAPRPRQFVVLGPPVVLCHSPFGLDPPLQLHPVERRVKRALADLDHLVCEL